VEHKGTFKVTASTHALPQPAFLIVKEEHDAVEAVEHPRSLHHGVRWDVACKPCVVPREDTEGN
jgi:hypothetical protein